MRFLIAAVFLVTVSVPAWAQPVQKLPSGLTFPAPSEALSTKYKSPSAKYKKKTKKHKNSSSNDASNVTPSETVSVPSTTSIETQVAPQ